MRERDIIIIGSGPAGLTAAIYAGRAGYKPLVIEGTMPGGQLMSTTDIENFPGFPERTSGPVLIKNIKDQAKKFGAEFLVAEVKQVELKTHPFKLTSDNDEFTAQSLIIATGATAKYLDIPSIQKLKGRGVSACATCDGFFFKDKIIYVIGGSDTAAEEALYLTKFGKEVNIVHRRDQLRAQKYMQEKLFNNTKINIIWNTVVEDVKDVTKGKVEKIILKNVKTGELTEKNADGIFMGIGHSPATGIFKGQLELDDNGYIIIKQGTQTSREGVFAAGDVRNPLYRQAVVAAGTGCMAAMDADRYLQTLK